jgi:hypothetical protein
MPGIGALRLLFGQDHASTGFCFGRWRLATVNYLHLGAPRMWVMYVLLYWGYLGWREEGTGNGGNYGKLFLKVISGSFFLVVRVADKDVPTLIQLFKKLYP